MKHKAWQGQQSGNARDAAGAQDRGQGAQALASQAARPGQAQTAQQRPQEPTKEAMKPAPEGAIMLDHPTIDLGEHIFVGVPPAQTKRLTPGCAYVFQGAIVIDEMNLILPLAGNIIRTR